jgi:hypothetical protein
MERARTEILMPCKRKYIYHCCFHTGIVWIERKIRKAVICLGKKVKVKLTLQPTVWHRGGVEVLVYSFFNFDVQWGVCLTPRLGRFTHRKWAGTHCIGGWVGLGDSLEGWGKNLPHRGSIPGPYRPWRVAVPTALRRRFDYKIKMDLVEMGFGDMDCIYLFKNTVQCRMFVAEPSAFNTHICALNKEGTFFSDLFISHLTCAC